MNGPLTPWSLARRQLTRAPLRLVALVISVAAAIAVAGGLPVAEASALDAGLGEAVTKSGYVALERPGVTTFDDFASFEHDSAARLRAQMGRYVGTGDLYASTGPVVPQTVNLVQATGSAASAHLTVAYYGDLAAHVVVLAGELPPDGLGGDYPPVTMPLAGADQAGLHLSDIVCASLAGTSAAWCGRIVGMWRPINPGDSYWAGTPPRLVFSLGSYDFFQLLALGPAGGATAGYHAAADAAAVVPGVTGDVERKLASLRAAVGKIPGIVLRTSLDQALSEYAVAQRATAQPISVMAFGLGLLALCLVALAGSRFVDLQAHDVGLLRAHGCPPTRVWEVLALELATGAVLAVPLGLVGAGIAVVTVGQPTGTPGWPPAGGEGALLGLAAAAAGTCLVLGAIAGVAAISGGTTGAPGRMPWQRGGADLLVAAAGLGLLLGIAVRPGGVFGAGGPGAALDAVLPVVAAAAVALAGLRALPVAARFLAGRRPDVAGQLAGWQIRRQPDRHAGLAYLLQVAAALAAFAAVGLVVEPLVVARLETLHQARQAALLLGLGAAIALALVAFALDFRAAVRDRRVEYAVLALHGLPAAALTRSLAAEQLAVLAHGVLAGTVLGLLLAAASAPDSVGATAIAGVAAILLATLAWALLPAGLAVGGWLVRRALVQEDLLDDLRRAT